MKKQIMLAILFIAATLASNAQFNIGFQLGANLPTAGIALPGFVQIEKNGSQKAIVATLGAGLNFNGEFGMQVNDNIALNLDFGLFKGFKGGFYQYLDTDPADGFQNNGAKLDITLGSSFIHVSPNIVISANSKPGKWKPYARFGIIMGSGKATITATVTGVPGKDVSVYDGGFSTGFLGGLGLQKSLGDKIKLFAEITTKTITSYPKTLTNTKTFTGAERAPTVHYKKELPANYEGPNQLTFALPYSSIGLTLGLNYIF
jgi:hypothetical protein